MIAADTSVLIDYFQGKDHLHTKKLDEFFTLHAVVLPPAVLSEIVSDPNLPKKFIEKMLELPLLEIDQNYWHRAGLNRSKLIAKKLKARLADALIAQSCIDHKIPLLTTDTDFRHFADHCGLILL
jgi:predicted nucleic acid-binding protein